MLFRHANHRGFQERKMAEYAWINWRRAIETIDHAFETMEAAQVGLVEAVEAGEVRCRADGEEFGPEWRKQWAALARADGNRFPTGIGFSTEDCRSRWPRR
jgi:hypothetical protein